MKLVLLLIGNLYSAPVWTAFITNHIGTRGWIRQADSRVVLLRELHRTIFTFDHYDPPRTSRGEHIIKFSNRSGWSIYFFVLMFLDVPWYLPYTDSSTSDAQGFMQTIAELAGH